MDCILDQLSDEFNLHPHTVKLRYLITGPQCVCVCVFFYHYVFGFALSEAGEQARTVSRDAKLSLAPLAFDLVQSLLFYTLLPR